MAGLTQQAYDKIGEIAVSIARIEERMIRYEENSIELTKAIKGNGKPGLLDRVSCIESQHSNEANAKKDAKEKKETWGARTWAIVVIAITAIVGNGAGLIVLLIRFGTIH